MILLKKDHQAVRELNPLRLLRLEYRERRYRDLAPVRGLSCRWWDHRDNCGRGEDQRKSNPLQVQIHRAPFHREPPWSGEPSSEELLSAGACSPPSPPPGTFSIIPTVRLVSLKVSLATRRISALVTRSMRSTERNNSRQSP